MPGLALPVAALRTKGPSGASSPAARSPAKATLPGTLLPLTGVVSPGASNCSSPVEKPQISPSINLKALIPDHVDEDIFDRYDFGERCPLGQGGYGSVYLAQDRQHSGRIVAVKKAMMMDSDMRENFQQEVGIMKELDHPNICTVYESYDHGRHVYLVMEYCSGGDLFDYILKHNGLPEVQVKEILRQVTSALKHAHDKGIAHRDLKPENVCFADDSDTDIHVKVIDWGLGFYFKRANMKTSVGTSAYAAPEVQQPVRGTYTSACDLWSLGAMACVMLTGEPPFFGQKPEEDSTGPQATSGPAWESISCEARSWVANLLRWNPSERLSADEVLNHPWLKTKASDTSTSSASQQVLANLHRFSKTSTFLSLCAASVAQQLSRKGLKELQAVFQDLDTNGDGMLQLHEVQSGFERMFGAGSAPLAEINDIFQRLDIDGSGAIDYTEFLAAGLGNRVNNEVDALWAAFKAFDVQESDGNITQAEIAQVLFEAGAGQMWSREKCEELAKEVVEQFDRDGNGSLDFDEWLLMMKRHEDPEPSLECHQRRVSL